jgi:hypothetical protein
LPSAVSDSVYIAFDICMEEHSLQPGCSCAILVRSGR